MGEGETQTAAATRIRLCGRFGAELEGRPVEDALAGRQSRLLFAYLALNRRRPIRRDELIDVVWPAGRPVSPGDALNTLLSRMRKELGPGVLNGRTELTLELGPEVVVDLEAAFDAVARAESALEGSGWEVALVEAGTALEVCEGGFLPEGDGEWVEQERQEVGELRLRALDCLAAAGLGAGGSRLSQAEQAARALVVSAPLRETGYRYLMEALAARSRVAEALEVYDEFRRLVVAELGAVPSPALRALHELLLGREQQTDPTGPLSLPPGMAAGERGDFVGRHADIEGLQAHLVKAREGTLQLVLLCGEPGIGKTRLATEFAVGAQREGATVLYGRCDEEELLPHQPFVEALRHYVSVCPLPELEGQVELISGELRRVVPELAERLPEIAEPMAGDPEGARYRLFEAVSALLCGAARNRPLILVLDDLHWADQSTLLLLKYLARSSRRAPLMVLGTYRETELEPDHQLSATLADLAREHRSERNRLARLDPAGVAALVLAHAGPDAPAEFNRLVYEGTEGNPFFVVEVLRHLVESGAVDAASGRWSRDLTPAQLALTEGVKDLIVRRLARLGEDADRVLALASVVGLGFDLAVMERLTDFGEERVVGALERAVRARVIEEVPGQVGRYAFSHALIRETRYGMLTATRRALLHRRVAVAFEEVYESDLDPRRAELAHHFAQAGSAGDLDKAIEYGAGAGERAVTLLAYEQAAGYYREAAKLIAVDVPRRQAQRCDLVIAQGEAERRGGDPGYRATLLDGARLARELEDTERLARAALANTRGMFSSALGVDRERVAVLDAALAGYEEGDSATRAALLAQLAVELVVDPDWPYRQSLSDEALAMARRVGDPRTLALVLNQRYVATFGPATLAERIANSAESGALAERLDDPLLASYAAYWGANVAMEAGEVERAEDQLDRLGAHARQLGQPILRWYEAMTRTKRCLIGGPPERAEELAFACFELGQSAGQPDAFAMFMNQLFMARFLGGALEKGDPDLPALFELPGSFPVGPEFTPSRSVQLGADAVKGVTFCEVGRRDAGHRHFEALMMDGFRLPHDFAALAIPAIASVACAHLGDARRAGRLYEMIEPYDGQFVDWGPSWLGAATHHMGVLAGVLGRPEEAEARLDDASEAYERLGAEPWLARARADRERLRKGG